MTLILKPRRDVNRTSKTVKGAFFLLVVVVLLSFSCFEDDRSLERRIAASPPADKSIKIVGFWHIGGNAQPTELTRDEFVQKQAKEILDSYLFTNDFDVELNYVTRVNLSNETKNILADSGFIHPLEPTAIENMKDEEEYFEFPTLSELHSFCMSPENDETVVFYMHSKTNDEWRNLMEEYLFGPECVGCLSNKKNVACGFNHVSDKQFIWQHFSGNFWMTRCSHISTLNPPFFEDLLDEAKHNPGGGSGYAWSFPPFGRSFAEFWVTNDVAGKRPPHEYRTVKGLIPLDQVCSNSLVREEQDENENEKDDDEEVSSIE